MTIKNLQELENEMLSSLRDRGITGDNEAAAVYLLHLREVSKNIEAWKSKRDAKDKNEKET